MDVTNTVEQWVAGNLVNNGFLLKFSGSQELDSQTFGNLKFFSRNTHTIFAPRLEVKWDDSVWDAGSLSELTDEDIILNVWNMHPQY